LSEIDPTDHALATIASILEHPGSSREVERTVVVETIVVTETSVSDEHPTVEEYGPVEEHATVEEHVIVEEHALEEHPTVEEQPLVPEHADAEGYTRVGPGPIDALRFRWSVQHGDDGQYYVHETIGDYSTPLVIGPMSSDAAVRMVDERAYEAQHRFEELRNEIAGRTAVAEFVHKGED
jgi:hypothetical protein